MPYSASVAWTLPTGMSSSFLGRVAGAGVVGGNLDVVVGGLLVGDVGGVAGGHVAGGAVLLLGMVVVAMAGVVWQARHLARKYWTRSAGEGLEWGSWQVVQVSLSPLARLQALRRRASYWLVARAPPACWLARTK